MQVSPPQQPAPQRTSRQLTDASGLPVRGPLKGALVALVLLMLGVLVWQLRAEFQQLESNQRERTEEYVSHLCQDLELSLQFKAHSALAIIRQNDNHDRLQLAAALTSIFPGLHSLTYLDHQGRRLYDSHRVDDSPFIQRLHRIHHTQPYHYAFSGESGGMIYLLLQEHPDDGRSASWVLRLPLELLSETLQLGERQQYAWLLEDQPSERILTRSLGLARSSPISVPVSAEDQGLTLSSQAVQGTDWQLRALFDPRGLQARLLPSMAGKLLLFTLISALTLITLYGLQREQRGLRELNAASRRSLHQAASALGAIEERVLVSDPDGLLTYLNPQAEAMFGLSSAHASGRPLRSLVPGLDPLLLNASALFSEEQPEIIQILQNGQARQFAVTRSELSENARLLGYVWVLRDVTEQQQALRVMQETRRRYQDIFEDSSTALCVLDLLGLRQFLHQQRIFSATALERWLNDHPERHDELLAQLHITEANQIALRLLGIAEQSQVNQYLLRRDSLASGGHTFQLITAVISGQTQLELETRIHTPQGHERHLWLVMRLPEMLQDYHAVTLGFSDITSRKRIEVSLIERERFWSEVVRAVPDTLYVHDIPGKRVMFSNNHLGPQLGYSKAELRALGDKLWEKILHPDDVELYQRMRNIQQVVGNEVLMQFELRWRHRDGSWHWFDIREQALARDAQGRVSRLIGIAKDITAQIEDRESLRENERRYRLLAESTSDVIYTTDAQLQLNYVSSSVEEALGYSSEWIMQHGMQQTAANPAQIVGVIELLERIRAAAGQPEALSRLRQLGSQQFFFDCLRADGQKIPVELRLMLMWDERDRFLGLHCIARDISQQRRAEKDLRMAATVFEHSTAAILVTDPTGAIVQVNHAFSRITGYQASEVLDRHPGVLTANHQQAGALQYIIDHLELRGSWEGEIWLKRKQGDLYPAWIGITAIRDDEGDLVSYVCFFSDISERKASEQRIHRLAYYDVLTQLPNRSLFQDRLHSALQHAERHGEWLVLMFLDLDRFKPINDSLGHAAGDRMLKEVAARLLGCVDEDETVARMGGDEFTLLLASRSTREGALNRAIHVAEAILAAMAQPFLLEGREFFVTASIGIALSPQDGQELSQLMKNADTAMYHAKEMGKNNFQFYQAEMNARALERLELESDLRHALEQGQFVLYYQPQFSGDGRCLTGAEALLRWQHPTRGLVSPVEFIPVLEELGLVVQVGDWALAEACAQMNRWQAAGMSIPKISVNLSARQFADGQLGLRISRILQEHQLPPTALEVELTESILMRDVGETLQILAGLKRLGLCIAVDDFGTGYSSLNYLKQFPIDVLKIDRSFVDGLPEGEQDAQIARAIIAMAHSLNLAVIAEGVETQAQLDFLREHGCDQVQGYLFGKPMPASQFSQLFSGPALFMLN